ncbi:MAG: hypothetical protein U0136_15500 [Bdellovibrionota bacterium]
MHLTRFLKLRKAVEGLDSHFIRTKLHDLDRSLKGQGLPLSPADTAITQEGIFYVEPITGIATKVVAYRATLTTPSNPKRNLKNPNKPYVAPQEIEKLGPYHLMRCNILTDAEKEGWPLEYTLSRRLSGSFPFRIVGQPRGKSKPEIYQSIDEQQLYVCSNCLWKASSILGPGKAPKRDAFNIQDFFDVNKARSWNSLGALAKDFGFMKNMYPEDWFEISKIRKRQINFHCEYCYRDLSAPHLQRYLHVHPTDHVENAEGYVRLECLCVACLADLPGYSDLKHHADFGAFRDA